MPATIAAKFAELAGAIAGVGSATDHEPMELGELPAVSMLLVRTAQADVATGIVERTWTWRVSLYLELRDYAEAQASMATLVPLLLDVTKNAPDLAGTCEQATLSDGGEEPVFAHEQGVLRKSLQLVAVTERV